MEELRAILTRQAFEAFRQDVEPAVHEARAFTSSWGIKFKDVTFDKVRIWHWAQDKNAPVQRIRYMAERLPHCIIKELPGDTPSILNPRLFLTELVPENGMHKTEV